MSTVAKSKSFATNLSHVSLKLFVAGNLNFCFWQNIRQEVKMSTLPRRESGISLASGIYEEISEDACKHPPASQPNHIYENPIEMLLDAQRGRHCKPPPLPPRALDFGGGKPRSGYKQRCNTLPAKDLARISQIFITESEYVVMGASKCDKTKEKSMITSITESLYMPMSPVINLKNKLENCYMIMNGNK